ncbi:MAG TPA: hypothetical protein PKD55_12670 [Bellilinea sp.]|nr:hypothetical protein [Bellilinea sp.]
MEDAASRFVERFYYWALADFQREIREGFPFLRRIKYKALQYRWLPSIVSLNSGDQISLASALVKRFHFGRGKLRSIEPMTSDETEWLQWYMGQIRYPGPAELQLNEQIAAGELRFFVNRRVLRNRVRDALRPVLGETVTPPNETDPEWNYEIPVGKWLIHTNVSLGGRHHQLSYFHRIAPADPHQGRRNWERYVYMTTPTSILYWFGIAGGGTAWDLLTDEDILETAQTLADLCSHFVQAAHGLLDGLEPSDDKT